MRLQADDHKLLASLSRLPHGQAFIELLQRSLDDVHARLQVATGEKIGWLQGEAQCLTEWLKHFQQADKLGR